MSRRGFKNKKILALCIGVVGSLVILSACNERVFEGHENEVTFIHTGDLHGSLRPSFNIRDGKFKGGLAKIFNVVNEIRARKHHTFLVHTGDVIQGSAEAMFTRGQAMIDVMNHFRIQAFVPGNWEFSYGIDRFLELFAGPAPVARWGALAANVYYTGEAPYADQVAGTRVLEPYRVVTLGTLRVGIFACTTNRGPTIVSSKVTQGVTFTDCKKGITFNAGTPEEKVIPPEIPTMVDILRNQENVDLVVMLSESGLAENIYNAENFSGIDIIFSSDQHEETNVPVLAKTPDGGLTFIAEEGEDGAQVGELTVTIVDKKIVSLTWKGHDIDDTVVANPWIESVIERISAPFRSGPDFVPGRFVNPYNGAKLNLPINAVIGYTEVPLTRNAYSYEYFPVTGKTPAIIEGSSHDFLADAFRVITGAQIGAIRGFRYVNDIPPGPITLEDIYALIPIGPQIAVGTITAAALNNQAENAADSVLNPDVTQWRGGWMFNFSDVTFDLLPYETRVLVGGTNPPENQLDQGRIANIQVGGVVVADAAQTFTYASYFYGDDPGQVNAIGAKDVQVFTKDGLLPPASVTPENVMDATEVVRLYLATFPNNTVTANDLAFPRINLTEPLPDSTVEFGFPVIEPLRGAFVRRLR